ncbi:MAG: DUF2750 domain-containing protein [Planctomycetes bacterium]|nr:DUF2750 domain-containing protein [Planctomycetota bacterium]
MFQLEADARDQHRRFVQRVLATEQVWGLRVNGSGWLECEANADPDRMVMPFWSDRAYVARYAPVMADRFSCAEPEAIALTVFLERFLPGLARDRRLVGTNWNRHGCGLEVEPCDLLDELGAGGG